MRIPSAFPELLYVIHGRKNKVILIDASLGCESERGKGACERKYTGTRERVIICAWIEVDYDTAPMYLDVGKD
jgi:hypothetical protein